MSLVDLYIQAIVPDMVYLFFFSGAGRQGKVSRFCLTARRCVSVWDDGRFSYWTGGILDYDEFRFILVGIQDGMLFTSNLDQFWQDKHRADNARRKISTYVGHTQK